MTYIIRRKSAMEAFFRRIFCDAVIGLSDSIEEGHNLTARARIVNAELAGIRTGRVSLSDSFLRAPKDCLIISVVRFHIAERGF